MAECLGSAANAGSNKYYADYSQSKCVKDCTDSDCGGLVGGVWDELYDDKSVCCAEKFWWVEDCDAQNTLWVSMGGIAADAVIGIDGENEVERVLGIAITPFHSKKSVSIVGLQCVQGQG